MLAVANALIVATCAGAIVFCVLYAVLAPWRRSAMGRNVMALMAIIALFLVLATMHMRWPHLFDHQQWIRPVMWALICGIVWWRVALLIHTQVLKRRDERVSR